MEHELTRVCPECRRRWYWPPRWGKPQGGVDAGVSVGGSHDFCEECLDRLELDQATPEERADFDQFMEARNRDVPMCEACASFHEARQKDERHLIKPRHEARCDVCNEWKPRDEVRLVTAAQAAGTETWACEECREGARP